MITKHGAQRTRQRLGIPKKAVEKLAKEALSGGRKSSEFVGSFRRYLDYLGIEYKTTPIVYNSFIWIFNGDTMITVYPVPTKYRNHAK